MTFRPEGDPSEIDRARYRPVANPDRISSFKHSVAGLRYMLRHEQSIHVLSVYTVTVLLLALWLQVDILLFIIVVIPMGFTWVVECLNTAIEAAVDLAMPEIHPLAKIAKDVGSAATFLSGGLSVLISLALLAPPLFVKLMG
jgi:diacylglycerol kinase